MFRALKDLLLIGFALSSLLAASQIPGFVQEYEQRLGGTRDEVTRLVAEFTSIAERADTDLAGYAIRLADNVDASISATGREILSLLERETAVAAHVDALAASSRLMKPLLTHRRGHHPATERRVRISLSVMPSPDDRERRRSNQQSAPRHKGRDDRT